jgi:hypothetical protein
MYGFERIVEQKIQDALEKGDLDNLPNKGKPLIMEDLSCVPEDLRMGYKVLKNAGILPEEMQLKKDIASLEELMASANLVHEEVDQTKAKLASKILRYKMLMEKKSERSHL